MEKNILQFTTQKQNIWFTSDTHMNHFNIIKYCERPWNDAEEMTEALIKNWNSVVKPEDIVFHLGDFMFGNLNRFWDIRSRLNGKIYLCAGNHDNELILNEWCIAGFEDIQSQYKIVIDGQKIYLNHFPLLTFDGIYKDKPTWQLFGHVHSNHEKDYKSPDQCRLDFLLPSQYDVGVDNNHYTPISFSQVKEIIQKQLLKNPIKK